MESGRADKTFEIDRDALHLIRLPFARPFLRPKQQASCNVLQVKKNAFVTPRHLLCDTGMVQFKSIAVFSILAIPALFGFCLDTETHAIITRGPSAMVDGTNGAVTVTVDQAGTTDTTINISTNNSSSLTVPSSVNLAAGNIHVQFQITASSTAGGSATVTATANGAHATSGSITFQEG